MVNRQTFYNNKCRPKIYLTHGFYNFCINIVQLLEPLIYMGKGYLGTLKREHSVKFLQLSILLQMYASNFRRHLAIEIQKREKKNLLIFFRLWNLAFFYWFTDESAGSFLSVLLIYPPHNWSFKF